MVYVDNFYITGAGRFGRMEMSHMIADTRDELFQMADKIGVARKWIQSFDTPREHFDICMSKRKLAIKFGAVEIGFRELAEMTMTRAYEGKQDSRNRNLKNTSYEIFRRTTKSSISFRAKERRADTA